jgi:hypothetical protein
MATTTVADLVAGGLAQKRTVEVSAGAADASKIPNLNASGVLDSSIVNSTVASAGAGSSGKLPALDAAGKLDSTVMPAGVGANSLAILTTEVIAAGALVNIWVSSGTKCRNADGVTGRVAHGFTLAGAGSGAACTVFFGGQITGLTAKTAGAAQFLGAAGAMTETPPTVSGATSISQVIGFADGATTVAFEPLPAITMA